MAIIFAQTSAPNFLSENDLRSKLAQRGDLFLSEISEQLERCSKNSELFLNSRIFDISQNICSEVYFYTAPGICSSEFLFLGVFLHSSGNSCSEVYFYTASRI